MTLIDFRKRKSVHVSLFSDTHRDFRKILIDRELSMQEVFQKFSELAASGDRRASKILDELVEEKRAGSVSRTKTSIDVRSIDSIYKLIGDNTAQENEDD